MMENKCKRFLSLLLAFVMILGMFPAGYAHVHAAEAGLTPVAPEAGKTYVICFKADNGDYYAMTSTYANKNNHGTLLTEKVTGTYNEAIGWNLVAADDNGGYYLNAADDGHGLSLNGTISNDAFADANHPAEIMTLEPSGDGYLIKNPSNRYVNALGAVAGNGSWGACGNWESGTTAYFFEIPEISINLTEGETYEVSGVAEAPNVTDNEVIDVESDFVQGTVKNHKLATTIEDGVYVIVNTRSNKWLLNTPVDGAKKLQNVAGEPNLGDNAYLWTVTAVEGEADTYYLGNNGKYLNLPGHEQAELVNDENATVRITTSPLYAYAWEIFDTNTYMNDLSSNVGSYTGQNDGGSQWVFYKVSDVPACTYAGVEELPSDATITSGNEYLLVNIRNGNKTLLNKQNPGANACLYLNGTANAPSNNAVWTITEHEGSYYIQDQNGKYLTFSSSAATVTTDSTPVSIGWQGFGSLGEAWAITRTVNGRKEYMSNPGGGNTNSGGGWHEENDGGSRWKIYTTSTTPVGTYDVTVTGKGVGEATVVIGMAIYTFHVSANHVHNFVGNVTTPANCVDEGVKTFTCECGEGTYTEVIPVDSKNHKTTEIRPEVKPTLTKEGKTEEVYCTACNTSVSGGETIPQLTMKNAKVLSDNRIVALSGCEYLLTSTGENTWSLSHAGTYFVKPSADGNNANPQSTAAFDQLTLTANGDAIWIGSALAGSAAGTGSIHVHNNAETPYWNRCSSAHGNQGNGTHDLYFFIANNDGTGAEIPGYTMVKKDALVSGNSYLIAFKNDNGTWYIMNPSDAANDHVALLVTDAVTHTHEYTVENVTKDPTCAETGLKDLKCSCGHFHAAEHKNVEIPAAHGTITHVAPKAATCTEAGNIEHWRCETCGETWADEACTQVIENVTIPALGHTFEREGGAWTKTCGDCGAPNENFVEVTYVAKIGEQGYETLADAIGAAQAGDTITFLADITESVTINKSVTIDGAGKTYTGQMTLKADTTIKNVNFDGKGYNGYAVETRGADYLTIEDCTAKNYGYGFVQLASGTVLTTVKNVTVSNMNYGVKIDYSNAVVLENVDITVGVAAVLNSNYGEKTITIKDSKLNILGTWTRNNTIKTTYVFEGANSIDDFITDATVDNFKLAAGATLTAPQDITVTTDVENHEVVYENGTYKLVEKKAAVAKIGEQGYETLAAAIAAANAGDTITFLTDITESVTINKSVTIDGAGKTYTGTMTGNAGLTITIENVDFVNGGFSKTTKSTTGTYTIKNCTFDGQGTYAYPVCIKGANKLVVEDCVVSNYLYSFLYVTSGTNTVSVKNVTVENCPSYAVYFASGVNNATFENLTVKNSDNGFVINNTANRSFTIKDCKMENVGTAIAHSKGTKAITCTAQGNNDFGTAVLSEYAKVVLTADATLTAPEGLNVTTNAGDGYKVIYEEGVYKVVYAPAAMIGEQGYATLGEAFAAAQDGDTIVVMKDIDLAKETPVLLDGSYNTYFKVEGKNVTVNMNGMTISGAYADSGKMLVGVFSTDNGGHLTVTGNGTVNLTATAKVYSLFANYEPGCSITIENGAYNLDKAHDSLLYSGCNTDANEGITVNGGTFILGNVGTGTNGKPWIINCLGGNDNATVVNGGTFNSDISHQFWANEVSIPADLALKNNGDGTWTLVEAVACAEEKASSSGSTVRKVGYATLQEAIDAVANGKTVTLLKDIELGAADVKAIPGNLTAMINVAGKSLTLDMNGKTITAAYDASELLYTVIYVGDGASLTVKGDGKIDLITGDTKAGKYDCVAYMFLKSGSTGALNIENGTFTANKVEDSMVYTNSDKVVNIKGGNWTLDNVGTKTNGAPWIFNTKGQNERTILVSGGTYNFNVAKQYYAREVSIVDANGNLSYVIDNGNGTWTVTGQTAEVGIVTPTWRTNYLLGYATFKDAVASIAKGAAETTIVLQKDITVKGQFIGYSYAQKVVIDLNGYTMSSTDKALTVYRAGTEVTVKNGTVYGNTTGGTIQATYGGKLTLGENVTIKSGGSATALKVDANSTLIVDKDTSYVLGGKNDLVVAEGATVQISAGYFKKPVQQAWCAEGYVPTDKLENGYYSVMEDPANGMAAVINGTYYATLQEAIAAADTGDTITVLADIAVDTSAVVANSSGYAAIYNIAEKDIIIDLNGKKIEATVNAADLESYKSGILLGVFCVDNNGELTLTGNGTVTANAVDASMTSDDSHLYSLLVAYGAGSKLTVENGTFHANSVSSALVYSQYDEIITINGGTYTLGNLGKGRNGSPWLFNAKGQNTQNILVNGGTFSADIQHQYYPFEVQMLKELALSKGEDGMYTVVPAVAYVNEQEWSSKWYTNYVGYATVEEAEAAVEPIKTKVVGKITYTSQQEYVTLLTGDGTNVLN